MREAKRILAKQPHWIIEEIQKENSLERLEQKTISWKVDHEKKHVYFLANIIFYVN